jgi:drug/metabolite transporter (DMT)-like permease
LTGFVLAAVLLGALIHATWNALIKAQADKFSAAALVAIGAGVIALPIIAILPMPQAAAWPYIAASSNIHVGYFALVAFAYRSADLGVAYPLTRGSAPPLTALLAFLLIGETLGLNQWLAIAAIAAGIVALSTDALLRGGLTRNTALAAFGNAGIIVVYTLVDGLGARAAGSGFVYVAWMLAGTAVLLFALGAGGLALTSYAIALLAMTQAPIGLVAALRETSVIFAAILGTLLFGESFGPKRWLALAAIVAGIILLRWSGG